MSARVPPARAICDSAATQDHHDSGLRAPVKRGHKTAELNDAVLFKRADLLRAQAQ
jgi:hypothetical protein